MRLLVAAVIALALVGCFAWLDVRSDLRENRDAREAAVRAVREDNAAAREDMRARLDSIESMIQHMRGDGGE